MNSLVGPVILGVLLIALATPLLIGAFLSDRKNKMWLRLGILMAGSGVMIMLCGGLAYLFL